MLRIETLTLNELAALMREMGLSVSNEALSAGIEQGLYPFAICVRMPGSNQRRFEIYKKLFVRWAADRSTDDGGAA